MTTNLLICHPDIPHDATTINSSETYDTTYPVTNLTTGPRQDVAQLATATANQLTIEFDSGSGSTDSADYLILARANLLQRDDVTKLILRQSAGSITAPATVSGGTCHLNPAKGVTVSSTTNKISNWSDALGLTAAFLQATEADQPWLTRSDNKENRLRYNTDFTNAAWDKTTRPVSFSGSTMTASATANSHGVYYSVGAAEDDRKLHYYWTSRQITGR